MAILLYLPGRWKMPEVITLGEALIDFVSLEAGVSLVEASSFAKAAGGAPGNVACGVAKLGHTSAFIGKVGDDPFGHFLEQTFRLAGTDTSRMLFSEEAKTGLAFVSLGPGMVPDFTFYRNPSADMLLRPDDIDAEFMQSAKIFHYGSISLISEPSRSATVSAADLARDAGLLISYDPNLRMSLWEGTESARLGIFEGLKGVNLLKVSEEELVFLTGADSPEGGTEELFSRYDCLGLIVVTRGAEGSFYCNRNASGYLPGFKIEAVDTTGAGDAFTAAMLVQILERNIGKDQLSRLGKPELDDICSYANAVGALATTKKGAIASLPTKQDVAVFLRLK